uniref:Uncharacterized protein n=1 Tax=Mycena chlorophos TaxID=658473 RepID=A0ABQ0LTX7_MYCCL|nr:predicted protein [Mycena chlorophos]
MSVKSKKREAPRKHIGVTQYAMAKKDTTRTCNLPSRFPSRTPNTHSSLTHTTTTHERALSWPSLHAASRYPSCGIQTTPTLRFASAVLPRRECCHECSEDSNASTLAGTSVFRSAALRCLRSWVDGGTDAVGRDGTGRSEDRVDNVKGGPGLAKRRDSPHVLRRLLCRSRKTRRLGHFFSLTWPPSRRTQHTSLRRPRRGFVGSSALRLLRKKDAGLRSCQCTRATSRIPRPFTRYHRCKRNARSIEPRPRSLHMTPSCHIPRPKIVISHQPRWGYDNPVESTSLANAKTS